jgi:hypothetical protein
MGGKGSNSKYDPKLALPEYFGRKSGKIWQIFPVFMAV